MIKVKIKQDHKYSVIKIVNISLLEVQFILKKQTN